LSCQPEHVTGYVDGALAEPERLAMETHLGACEPCRNQAETERALRSRLLGLLHPPLPAGLDVRVRRGLKPRKRWLLAKALLPLAAAAAIVLFIGRQSAQLVAWELARDHDHCYGFETLGFEVRAEEAEPVMRWFEERGTRMPVIPTEAAGLEVAGGRYCPLPDFSYAAHVFYRNPDKPPISLFVLSRHLRDGEDVQLTMRGHVVRLTRVGETTVGLVGDKEEDVENFARTFRTSVAAR
jgi:hypothetical protein